MTNAWTERIAELEAKLDTFEAENRRLREAIEKAKRALSMGSTTREREAWQALTEQIAREAREG